MRRDRHPLPLQRLRPRSEEHTSELQSHRDLHSFPTRRSSDLAAGVLATGAVMMAETMSAPAHAQGSPSAPPPASAPGAAAQQTPAQRLIGDIAPKLAALT